MGQFLFSNNDLSSLVYIATGLEPVNTDGDTVLTLPALIGASVLLLTYNSVVFVPENPVVDSSGYMFNSPTGTFTFGLMLQAGDIIQILFTQ